MARPTCWECGKQLMYAHGAPVSAIVVEDGVEHRVHKRCAERRSGRSFVRNWSAVRDVRVALCTTGCRR